jgi:hypothetical protein
LILSGRFADAQRAARVAHGGEAGARLADELEMAAGSYRPLRKEGQVRQAIE